MTHRNTPTAEEALSSRHLHHSKLGAALKLIRDAETWWAVKICLLFVAFTAARSSQARLATWDEIDWDTATWHIPAAHTKSGRPYDLSLSYPAIEILTYAKARTNGQGLIFPAERGGTCLDTTRLSALMRRLTIPSTPHGIRSSFRHWAAEQPEIAATIADEVLAHVPNLPLDAAILADERFQERISVMQVWADYLTETMGPVMPQ